VNAGRHLEKITLNQHHHEEKIQIQILVLEVITEKEKSVPKMGPDQVPKTVPVLKLKHLFSTNSGTWEIFQYLLNAQPCSKTLKNILIFLTGTKKGTLL